MARSSARAEEGLERAGDREEVFRAAEDAEYADVLGADTEAGEARTLAAGYRRYAARSLEPGLNAREQAAANADVHVSNALHERLTHRHQAANRAALDNVSRAALTIATVAGRLLDRSRPTSSAGDLVRAAEASEVAAAAAATVPEDSDGTDTALHAVLDAARQTLTARRNHVAAVDEAAGADEETARVGENAGGVGVVDVGPATEDTFESWSRALTDIREYCIRRATTRRWQTRRRQQRQDRDIARWVTGC